MTGIIRPLLLAAVIGLLLCGYSDAATKKSGKTMPTTKGAQHKMKTYYMGRFAIDLPEEFKLEIQRFRFRLVEIEEYQDIQDGEQKWKSHLTKIEKLQKPKRVKKNIIKEIQIDGLGKWARGVMYYGDHRADDECKWDIFVFNGHNGVLFSLDGLLDKEKSMFAWLKEVANAYRPQAFQKAQGDHIFYTQHGLIDLPYKRQEKTYTRFAGPMGMKLEVEMKEIHQANKDGIISRTVAAMETGLASGLKIKKIRSQKRIVANLGGEEEILQGDEGGEKHLSFDWEYLGTVDSGEKPWIQITVDTGQDHLDEKIQIWDAALESFRPASKR